MNSAPIFAFIVILQVIAYGAAWYRFTTGKSCITDSGKSGTCILVKDCPDAIESLRAGGSPKPCGFEGVIPKVCCANLARLRETLPEKSKSCTTDSGKSGTCILVKDCPEAIKSLRAGGSPKPCGFEGVIPKVCCANLARVPESLPEKSKSCTTDAGKLGTCILVQNCQEAIKSLRAGGSPKPCGFEGDIPKVCCPNLSRLRESLVNKSKSCTTDSGKSGTCILVKDCPEAIKLLRAGGIPTQCGFEGDIPKVCCANLARLRESLPEKSKSCTTDAGKRGTCILVQNCQEAIKSLRAGGSPKLCGFEGDIPKVCCPNLSRLRESLANKKCLEYRIKAMPTTRTTSKLPYDVVEMQKGQPALPLEFPHMAVLGYGKKNTNRLCGGSLISENFVLTAAHCFKGNVTNVKLGMHQFSVWTNYVQEFRVKKIYPHPDYLTSRLYHDIGLIELDRPAYIDAEGVKPACLHTSKDIPTNSFIGTGWGVTEWYGEYSDVLQKANLNYVAYENCAWYYNWQIRLPNGLEDASQFCADGGGARADTCQGDSGGPLQIPLDDRIYTIVGITAFGIKCAIVPGVYTRVSYYVPWIESIVWAKAADIL